MLSDFALQFLQTSLVSLAVRTSDGIAGIAVGFGSHPLDKLLYDGLKMMYFVDSSESLPVNGHCDAIILKHLADLVEDDANFKLKFLLISSVALFTALRLSEIEPIAVLDEILQSKVVFHN